MTLKPLRDNVVILVSKDTDASEKSDKKKSITIPDGTTAKYGKVIACGPEATDLDGQQVVFMQGIGAAITIEDSEYIILNHRDALALILDK